MDERRMHCQLGWHNYPHVGARLCPQLPIRPDLQNILSDYAGRAAEEASRAAVAEVVAELQERVSRRVPRS
jgi:hypothetical protein